MADDQLNKVVVDYFMRVTGEKFDEVSKRLERIEHKTDQLIGFRWMLIGMATAVSALMSLIITLMLKQ